MCIRDRCSSWSVPPLDLKDVVRLPATLPIWERFGPGPSGHRQAGCVRMPAAKRRCRAEMCIRDSRPIVYICSPYAGDVKANILNARRYCRFAVQKDCIPIASHLFFPQFMDDNDAKQRDLGLYMATVLSLIHI